MSTVAVLGASDKPQRISRQAVERLLAAGHEVFAVNPRGGEVRGVAVLPQLGAIGKAVDTLTVYVAPHHQAALLEDILALRPRRVIFNPGAENPAIYPALQRAGIAVTEACTLVLLATHQFDDAR